MIPKPVRTLMADHPLMVLAALAIVLDPIGSMIFHPLGLPFPSCSGAQSSAHRREIHGQFWRRLFETIREPNADWLRLSAQFVRRTRD